jgi:Rad3-related DNA helicase
MRGRIRQEVDLFDSEILRAFDSGKTKTEIYNEFRSKGWTYPTIEQRYNLLNKEREQKQKAERDKKDAEHEKLKNVVEELKKAMGDD